MNSDSDIDSDIDSDLLADSEYKYMSGDYNALYCNDGKKKNKTKEQEENGEIENQINENGSTSVKKLTTTESELDVKVSQQENKADNADVVDGPREETVDVVSGNNENSVTVGKENNDTGAKLIPDQIDKDTLAIFQYSDNLAETIVQEAILINEIYTRDKINIDNITEPENADRDAEIKKTLFPNDNGIVSGRETGAGYDSYLIEKLLRSKADPEEFPDADGFDGKEDHFKRDKDSTYPGLDCDDAYVRAGLERPDSDRESSDKNNNEMPPGIIEQFDDNVLQTIHEDAELVIEYADNDGPGVNNRGPDEGVPVIDHVGYVNKGVCEVVVEQDEDVIDDGVVEDVAPNNDNADEVIKTDTNQNDEVKEQIQSVIDNKQTGAETVPVVEDIEEESEDDSEDADCCDMTHREKRAMVNAVRHGDIDRLEKLLEKKNADMNMIWYGENLLMVAIRAGKEAMCEFLIDNGINWEHVTKLVEKEENGDICVHKMTARQMAYDLQLLDTVELLDCKTNNLFPFIVPKLREPRLREPIVPLIPPSLDEGIRQEFLMDPDELMALHKERLIERARIQAEELEESKTEKSRKSVTTTCVEDETFHTVKSKHSCSYDDLSQVFGPDEGYETMSPDPSRSNRQDYHVVTAVPVSIRSTRAANLKKSHITATKGNKLKRDKSPDYPMFNTTTNHLIESVGSYSFESRYWHMPKSAPQLRNYSVESLNDTSVHVGLPFVHGDSRKRLLSTPPQSARPSLNQRRAASAHSNVSPFSQVAKLLEQSKLFNPLDKSRATTPHLPTISSRKSSAALQVTHTRINYIYADRNSAKSPRKEAFAERSDLLPKRKLKC